MLVTLTCAIFCSSVGLYFVHRFSRMALLENQLEVLYSQQQITVPHCYRLVDCFPSYKTGPCQDCKNIHSPINFISIFYLNKTMRSKIVFSFIFCELSLFALLQCFTAKYDISATSIIYLFMILVFFIITIVDYRYYIIPDELNFLGIFIGFGLSLISSIAIYTNSISSHDFFAGLHSFTISNSFFGIVLSAGILLSIAFLTSVYLGRDAMGGGDIKLTAFIGAFLGYKATLIALALSSILGSIFGIISMVKSKLIQKNQGYTMIAFGPYIIMATLIVMYFGDDQIIRYYERLSLSWVHGYIVP